jgi:two-component sensor histidine kinase
VTICWTERGGPPVKQPHKLGVGTKVMESMIGGQSGGTIRFDWNPQGLSCELSLPVC